MGFARRCNRIAPLTADGYLAPYAGVLRRRGEVAAREAARLSEGRAGGLAAFADGAEYFGLHRRRGKWIFREYAPHAENIILAGDFSNWNNDERFRLKPVGSGVWEGHFPLDSMAHGMRYCMRVKWHDGGGERLPAYLRRAVQDEKTLRFSGMIWQPDTPYRFRYHRPNAAFPRIYEAHIGSAQEKCGIGSYDEFAALLPEIAASGYNTIQLMGVMEHPYYGSFGYHVSNFFAVSSRLGTPDEFKHLVDEAHRSNLRVIIDLVHSHSVKNDAEGLSTIDGSRETYFHPGEKGWHSAWDSLCFDYGKMEVLRFLLSNCRYYLEEFNVDGFRFDGVTSMLYSHHGLGHVFTGYDDYFSPDVDLDALVYLTLANRLIHRLVPEAVTVAEDVSGMPLLASPEGVGFDYRLAMGITDIWFKMLDIPDEKWSVSQLYGELLNRRQDEMTISYVECHDQAIVGGQSSFFRLAGRAVYDSMKCDCSSLVIDRAMALHKMMRLITAATAGHGYLNFAGNEFGHPEWLDLPREGNNWSFHYARRQWHLAKDPELRYKYLGDFDRAMMDIVSGKDFYECRVQRLLLDEAGAIVAFERAGMIFVFNFSAETSQTDYEIEVPSGIYQTVLDSDESRFGGVERRIPRQEYYTLPRREGLFISLYLPARSALVLKRQALM